MSSLCLQPQRFLSPTLRKSHRCRVHCRELCQQFLDVTGKGVLRVDTVQPVGYAAELRIKFIGVEGKIGNPCVGQFAKQHRLYREMHIPQTSMVSTLITQSCQTLQPATKVEWLRYAKITRHLFLCMIICDIVIHFRQRPHRSNLKRFPRRRHVWLFILQEMLLNKFVSRPLQFTTQLSQLPSKLSCIAKHSFVHEPKGAKLHREMKYDTTTNGYFNALDSSEDNGLQLRIEIVVRKCGRKMAFGTECMFRMSTAYGFFHQLPILCKSKIANETKPFYCLLLVVDDKPTLLQGFYLLSKGHCLLGILHEGIKKRPATGTLHSFTRRKRSAAGIVAAKVRTFCETAKQIGKNLSQWHQISLNEITK